jgi:predicted nucleic acid-binding Zn ribbon protein
VSPPSRAPEVPSEAVRTPSAGDEVGSCPVCGVLLTGRKDQETCSPRCRAKRHRERQAEARAARDAEIRRLLEAALRLVDGGTAMTRRAILGLTLTLALLAALLAAEAQPGKVARVGVLAGGGSLFHAGFESFRQRLR